MGNQISLNFGRMNFKYTLLVALIGLTLSAMVDASPKKGKDYNKDDEGKEDKVNEDKDQGDEKDEDKEDDDKEDDDKEDDDKEDDDKDDGDEVCKDQKWW